MLEVCSHAEVDSTNQSTLEFPIIGSGLRLNVWKFILNASIQKNNLVISLLKGLPVDVFRFARKRLMGW